MKTIEIAHFLWTVAVACMVIKIIYIFFAKPHTYNSKKFTSILNPLYYTSTIAVIIATAIIIYSFIVSDFSLQLVADNSHSAKPLFYKITALWSNHEGSIMLWVLFLACVNFGFYYCTKKAPDSIKSILYYALPIQNGITVIFAMYCLFLNSPFARIFPIPIEGLGLNPVLQDVGLALHPPLIYAGYVLLSIPYSIMIVATCRRSISCEVLSYMRPLLKSIWGILGTGIIMGSLWAYRELGWGGFWFWDPVENVALLPWLIITALLHISKVTEKSAILHYFTTFLSVFGFLSSIFATFVVRSGLIVSVHSFAEDSTKGVWILSMFAIFSLPSLFIITRYAYGKQDIKKNSISKNNTSNTNTSKPDNSNANNAKFSTSNNNTKHHDTSHMSSKNNTIKNISSTESISNWQIFSKKIPIYILLMGLSGALLSVVMVIVLLGTIYPSAVMMIQGYEISIGASYYNTIVMPILILTITLTIFLNITTNAKKYFICLMLFSVILTVAITFALYHQHTQFNPLYTIIIFILCMPISSAIWQCVLRKKILMQMAHMGFALFLLGAVISELYSKAYTLQLEKNTAVTLNGATYTLQSVQIENWKNYKRKTATLTIEKNAQSIGILNPENRYYPATDTTTVESSIVYSGILKMDNIYIVMGQKNKDKETFTLYIKPFIMMLWFGAFLMILSCGISVIRTKIRKHINA